MYEPYLDTDWCKELIEMQRIQRKINVMESYTYGERSTSYWQTPKEPLADIYGKPVINELAGQKPKAVRKPGRPKIAEAIVQDIMDTFKIHPHWSVNRFVEEMTKKGYTISRETIRKVIVLLKQEMSKELTNNSFIDR